MLIFKPLWFFENENFSAWQKLSIFGIELNWIEKSTKSIHPSPFPPPPGPQYIPVLAASSCDLSLLSMQWPFLHIFNIQKVEVDLLGKCFMERNVKDVTQFIDSFYYQSILYGPKILYSIGVKQFLNGVCFCTHCNFRPSGILL